MFLRISKQSCVVFTLFNTVFKAAFNSLKILAQKKKTNILRYRITVKKNNNKNTKTFLYH